VHYLQQRCQRRRHTSLVVSAMHAFLRNVGCLWNVLSRQIKVDSLFTSYRIQSNASNEITMSLSTEALLAALRSASSSASASSSYETEEVVMKLAKKNDQAALSFEISGTTRVGRRVKVAHDVKIEVMKPSDVARLSEPMCPEPDVSLDMMSD